MGCFTHLSPATDPAQRYEQYGYPGRLTAAFLTRSAKAGSREFTKFRYRNDSHLQTLLPSVPKNFQNRFSRPLSVRSEALDGLFVERQQFRQRYRTRLRICLFVLPDFLFNPCFRQAPDQSS